MNLFTNPWIARLEAYIPGEQPREPGFIKLNTNESPYPPAPEVLDAVRRSAEEALFNKYPDPASCALRAALARQNGVRPEQVLVGNGSDEVLRLICHTFLDPGRDRIGMVHPTYSLYRTLAALFGCESVSWDPEAPDYAIPAGVKTAPVRIVFLANPNPPIGTWWPVAALADLAAADPDRLLVIDEAYVDFAEGDALEVMRNHPNVLISRTFSKSYSLAGLRVGYVIAGEELIAQMDKARDSYNVNRVSQAAALAAVGAGQYYLEKCAVIRADRAYLTGQLRARGFEVPESQGNFVFARRQGAAGLYQKLKELKILVRYFSDPALADGVRITVGTREEVDALLRAIDQLAGTEENPLVSAAPPAELS